MGILEILGIAGGCITILGTIVSISIAWSKKHTASDVAYKEVQEFQSRYDNFSYLLGEISGKLGQILTRFDEVQDEVNGLDERLREVEKHHGIKLVNGKGNT